MQHLDDDEIRTTYWETCKLASMVCLRKVSNGELISSEVIKHDLILNSVRN